jgi:hypothetical protein
MNKRSSGTTIGDKSGVDKSGVRVPFRRGWVGLLRRQCRSRAQTPRFPLFSRMSGLQRRRGAKHAGQAAMAAGNSPSPLAGEGLGRGGQCTAQARPAHPAAHALLRSPSAQSCADPRPLEGLDLRPPSSARGEGVATRIVDDPRASMHRPLITLGNYDHRSGNPQTLASVSRARPRPRCRRVGCEVLSFRRRRRERRSDIRAGDLDDAGVSPTKRPGGTP